ncbi:MAG: hypothetical protein KAX20_07915 [Candidatus Omnitrophica bacterium]|nr:hypothetical protein [Candidatus Omnitrophota bacterium]
MAKINRKKLAILILVCLVILLVPCSLTIDKVRVAANLSERGALGFNNLMADVLWVETIQYMGEAKKITDEIATTIYQKIERITDLDPHFIMAYRLAGLTLSNKRPELSIRILSKGLENNPGASWEIPFYAGVISYFRLEDYRGAVRYLEAATTHPECPDFIKRFLARATTEVGSYKDALLLWEGIYEETESPTERGIAARHLIRLCSQIMEISTDRNLVAKAKAILRKISE